VHESNSKTVCLKDLSSSSMVLSPLNLQCIWHTPSVIGGSNISLLRIPKVPFIVNIISQNGRNVQEGTFTDCECKMSVSQDHRSNIYNVGGGGVRTSESLHYVCVDNMISQVSQRIRNSLIH